MSWLVVSWNVGSVMPTRGHRLRLYFPAALLLAGCGLLWQTRAQSAIPLEGDLSSVLSSVDGFDAQEQLISEDERRVAGMTNYVARQYMHRGTLAFTSLVSYYDKQTHGKTIHSPRNCLPGAGWEIVNRGTAVVQSDGVEYRVNRYVLKNKRYVALAYYWYQGRGRVTANEYAVKWNLLRDAALRGRTEEALVRIVIPVPDADVIGLNDDAVLPQDTLARIVTSRMIREVRSALPKATAPHPAA